MDPTAGKDLQWGGGRNRGKDEASPKDRNQIHVRGPETGQEGLQLVFGLNLGYI